MKNEMTGEEFQEWCNERDKLKARVRELEQRPIRGSVDHMAATVSDAVTSLTPGQRGLIFQAIREYIG